MKNEDNKDIVERLDDYLLSNKVPMKSKVKNTRHITCRIPDGLYETLQDWGYRHNRSLSHTIRGFLYLAEMENLYELKQWVFDETDTREIDEVLKSQTKDGDE